MNTEFYRYPTIAERDEAWGLCVTGGGYVRVEPRSPYPLETHPSGYQFRWPHRRVLDEYQLLLITSGSGEFESEEAGRRRIAAGNLIVTFPGQWHRYRPTPSIGWEQYWVGFRGEIADRLVDQKFLQPATAVLDTSLDETVLAAFQRLLDRLQSDPPAAHQLMAGNILEIVGASLAASRRGRLPDEEAEVIQRAKQLLQSKSEQGKTIEAIAQTLGMSGTHFRRLFKRHTGMAPYQYQLHLRINRAREMLHGTSLPIREVASAVGFENPYHFSAAFKRKTGVSPSEWRGRQEETSRRSEDLFSNPSKMRTREPGSSGASAS